MKNIEIKPSYLIMFGAMFLVIIALTFFSDYKIGSQMMSKLNPPIGMDDKPVLQGVDDSLSPEPISITSADERGCPSGQEECGVGYCYNPNNWECISDGVFCPKWLKHVVNGKCVP